MGKRAFKAQSSTHSGEYQDELVNLKARLHAGQEQLGRLRASTVGTHILKHNASLRQRALPVLLTAEVKRNLHSRIEERKASSPFIFAKLRTFAAPRLGPPRGAVGLAGAQDFLNPRPLWSILDPPGLRPGKITASARLLLAGFAVCQLAATPELAQRSRAVTPQSLGGGGDRGENREEGRDLSLGPVAKKLDPRALAVSSRGAAASPCPQVAQQSFLELGAQKTPGGGKNLGPRRSPRGSQTARSSSPSRAWAPGWRQLGRGPATPMLHGLGPVPPPLWGAVSASRWGGGGPQPLPQVSKEGSGLASPDPSCCVRAGLGAARTRPGPGVSGWALGVSGARGGSSCALVGARA
ncbi:rho GTPase-activating protein SYDE1-like [Nomascus leucogenys]|uniref:rho GTPase-activating protein SYDE1-like n=1 Tax=Nomascus leucogenys TaxID=61853 RepID=UPI00122D9C19|nr:rho GTPase-activating protein SYDE1-like [Nomascus leucogenys]